MRKSFPKKLQIFAQIFNQNCEFWALCSIFTNLIGILAHSVMCLCISCKLIDKIHRFFTFCYFFQLFNNLIAHNDFFHIFPGWRAKLIWGTIASRGGWIRRACPAEEIIGGLLMFAGCRGTSEWAISLTVGNLELNTCWWSIARESCGI